jgi:hypothetical protein
VPMMKATTMMMTVVHAAGELPWPATEPADTILLGGWPEWALGMK